ERAVIKRSPIEPAEPCGHGGARVFVLEVQFHQRREAEAQAIGVGPGEYNAQNGVEQEAGFKIRSGGGVLNASDAIAQVELFGALLDRPEKALQTPSQIGCLADVGFGLGVGATQKEHRRSGRDGGKDLAVSLRREFQAVGQHGFILVGINHGDTEARRIPGLPEASATATEKISVSSPCLCDSVVRCYRKLALLTRSR